MPAIAAPNACNGCHLEKSPAWTIAELDRMWRRHIVADQSWARAWGGSLDTPAMDAWAKSSSQHTKLALIEALSRRRDRDSIMRLESLLDDPAGTTRAFAAMAIERRIGRALDSSEIDVTAPSERRRQQIEALRASLRSDALR